MTVTAWMPGICAEDKLNTCSGLEICYEQDENFLKEYVHLHVSVQ